MKNIFINLILCIFTMNQAMAYMPTAEDREISNALDQLSKEFESEGTSKLFLGKRILTEAGFKNEKEKLISHLNNEISKVENLNQDEQKEYLSNKTKKQFARAEKVTKKLLKRKYLLAKMARKSGVSKEQFANKIKSLASTRTQEKTLMMVNDKSEEIGGYEYLLKDKINEVKELSYDSYKQKMSGNNKTFKLPTQKSINSDDDFVIMFFIFIILYVYYGSIAVIILLVIAAIVAIVGGVAAPILITAGIVAAPILIVAVLSI